MKIVSDSFIEKSARERIIALLDQGSFREILDPFEKITSPWLEMQGIVPQYDDGAVIGKGTLDSNPCVMIGIEGSFQGGSIGEVSGAKIAGSLEMALKDNEKGIPTRAILLLETGGVRLQEANLGLAAIAEIHSAIVALREYQPVIAVIAGTVGCFGGMSIAAALCSDIIMTREARLGLNGPQVIEQEAGIQEFNSKDRPFIWGITGGEQRFQTGFADFYVQDNTKEIAHLVRAIYKKEKKSTRDQEYSYFLEKIKQINPDQMAQPETVRSIFKNKGGSK
jgi:malonate decarboxylase beta subunit